jgi:hypothetical protein
MVTVIDTRPFIELIDEIPKPVSITIGMMMLLFTSSVGNIAHWDYNGDGYMTKIFTRLVKRCEQCPQSGFKYDMWKQQSKYYCYTFEQYIDDIMTIPSWCKLEDLEDD